MRKINQIVVHCSATREGQHFDVHDIRKWHLQRGWSDVGYHAIVLLDGTIQPGRPEELSGAHAAGHNAHSLGIVYIGGLELDGQTPKDSRTPAQKLAMRAQILEWMHEYGVTVENVVGHRELPGVAKACPCFEVETLREELRAELRDLSPEPSLKSVPPVLPLVIDLPTLWPLPDGDYPATATREILFRLFRLSRPVTKASVQVFQTHQGLKPDGIVGPVTWSALLAQE